MSNYNPRGTRAPTLSHIANLNSIPTQQDLALQQQEPYNVEDELAIFTNSEFFDFDLGQMDHPPIEYDPLQEERARRGNASAMRNAVKPTHFVDGEPSFTDFASFQNFLNDGMAQEPPVSHAQHQSPIYPVNTVTSSPESGLVSPQMGEKRKAESLQSLEDASRLAAEEDKRKRNTAASARFRVKKKQREQTLERTAKDMSDKNAQLEARIQQLEMENKWLKNLITDKNDTKDDVNELWKKYSKSSADGRSISERTDGVGTKDDKAT